MATSLATLYLSYGINHVPRGSSLFFPLETAQHYLAVIEPIQIGYGAVVSTIKQATMVQVRSLLISARFFHSLVQSTGVSSTPGMVGIRV
jgi:hypothetical protein